MSDWTWIMVEQVTWVDERFALMLAGVSLVWGLACGFVVGRAYRGSRSPEGTEGREP